MDAYLLAGGDLIPAAFNYLTQTQTLAWFGDVTWTLIFWVGLFLGIRVALVHGLLPVAMAFSATHSFRPHRTL